MIFCLSRTRNFFYITDFVDFWSAFLVLVVILGMKKRFGAIFVFEIVNGTNEADHNSKYVCIVKWLHKK